MERFLVHRSLCDWELWTTSQVMHIFFPRNWWLSGVWLCVNLELDYWRILCPMTAMTWSGGLEPMHLSSSPKCKRIDGWMESCKGNALRYWPKIGMSWYQPFCLISVFLKMVSLRLKISFPSETWQDYTTCTDFKNRKCNTSATTVYPEATLFWMAEEQKVVCLL